MREDNYKIALHVSIFSILAIDLIAIICAVIFGVLLGVGAILQSQIMIIATIIIAAINVLGIIAIPILLKNIKG